MPKVPTLPKTFKPTPTPCSSWMARPQTGSDHKCKKEEGHEEDHSDGSHVWVNSSVDSEVSGDG